MQNPATYIIGDVHGEYKKLLKLLKSAKLIGEEPHSWTGGQTNLWFMGDLVDRGPEGIAVVELLMHLQAQAAATGGLVESLVGNHEVLLLAAYRFGRRSTGLGSPFITKWKQNGGQMKDIAGLTTRSIEWLSQRPAMARLGDYTLLHADAPFYLTYGQTIEEVNKAINTLMKRSDALAWEELLEDFARRGAFMHTDYDDGLSLRFLDRFGGQKLIHGHTPINAMSGGSLKHVTEPWVYADGRCINVDGGMFLGGNGFIYQLPQ